MGDGCNFPIQKPLAAGLLVIPSISKEGSTGRIYGKNSASVHMRLKGVYTGGVVLFLFCGWRGKK